jgi:hypothetical protein
VRIGLAVLWLLASAGCPIHLQRNAPGNIDVRTPPREPVEGTVEEPIDPGEHVVTVGLGAFGGAGIGVRSGDRLAAEAGVELGVYWGESDTSHHKPDLFPMPMVLTDERRGFNVGWVFYEPDADDAGRGELGPLYAEWYEGGRLWSWSAGYSYDPQDGSHGPQVTIAGLGYYGKLSARFDRGVEGIIGVVLKWPQSIVWSR